MKVVAIVQARMGSIRLPGKTLAHIMGRPLLQHVIDRMCCSELLTEIVVATTEAGKDDVIEQLAKRLKVPVFRGSEENVLARFFACADAFSAQLIVRVTADDPFKDPQITDRAISRMLSDLSLDYVSNTIHPTYPEGLDVEVFTIEALARAFREARRLEDIEHVTPYIWNNPKQFRIQNIENTGDLSYMRWTIDTQADLDFTRQVYGHLYDPARLFLMDDVLRLLEERPELGQINRNVERFVSHKECRHQQD